MKYLGRLLGGRILVSVKKTRLQAESARLGLEGEPLLKELSMRGFNVNSLQASHDRHIRSFDAIVNSLEKRGLSYSVHYAKGLSAHEVQEAEFVICVGGDGTLLETAQLVRTPKVPVLGINSDPQSSTGKLCSVAMRSRYDFDNCLHRIERDNFAWFLRSRVGLTLVDKEGNQRTVEKPALNEVLIAEHDVCRPTMHRTKIDDTDFGPVQKSCGVIVCSGSGSTAWMHSASAVRVDDAELILDAAGVYDFKHVAARVANVVNREFILPPTSTNVMYYVRESMFPASSSAQTNSKSHAPRRGFASNVSVISLGFDTYVFLDGLASFPVENGTIAMMRINPEISLRTFIF
jgi:NAD+ kinase